MFHGSDGWKPKLMYSWTGRMSKDTTLIITSKTRYDWAVMGMSIRGRCAVIWKELIDENSCWMDNSKMKARKTFATTSEFEAKLAYSYVAYNSLCIWGGTGISI